MPTLDIAKQVWKCVGARDRDDQRSKKWEKPMKSTFPFVSLVIAVLSLFLVGVVSAGELRLSCKYSDQGVQAEWNGDGRPEISERGFGDDSFVLTVDTASGKAQLHANSTVEVIAIPLEASINFIEETPTGLSITSVYLRALPDGHLPFVQSRHLDFMGPFPQQYYGSCQLVE
jgi:hypothetical protein